MEAFRTNTKIDFVQINYEKKLLGNTKLDIKIKA